MTGVVEGTGRRLGSALWQVGMRLPILGSVPGRATRQTSRDIPKKQDR
jgi:hypothetical protein